MQDAKTAQSAAVQVEDDGLEFVLCGNAIRASTHLLNHIAPGQDSSNEDTWGDVKQMVIRDLLSLWTASRYEESSLARSIEALEHRKGDVAKKYKVLVEETNLHFGGIQAPALFRIPEIELSTEVCEEYWSLLSKNNGQKFPFHACHLSIVSSVYDEIIDYTPCILEQPHQWKISQKLPILKPCEADCAQFLPGQRGLIRQHSRDNATSDRDKKGAFYTPYRIAYDIVQRTLAPLVNGLSVSDVLRLNICDPAMGSGIFLLAATEFLSDTLQSCPNDERLMSLINDDFACRRAVLANCLHGVDLDQTALAVAAGVLSCSFQNGTQEPIDFSLSLRRGNSLLGLPTSEYFTLPHMAYEDRRRNRKARDANDKAYADQIAGIVEEMKSIRKRMKSTLEQLNNPSSSLQVTFGGAPDFETQQRERLSALKSRDSVLRQSIQQILKQPPRASSTLIQFLHEDEHSRGAFKNLADAMLACWWQRERKMQHDLTTNSVFLYLQFLLSKEDVVEGRLLENLKRRAISQKTPASFEKIFEQTSRISEELRFFHWDMEFPEIFLNQSENVGFDAIIGNPPWGIPLSQIERNRFSWAFPRSGDFETAWAFLELAMQRVKPRDGRIGFIVPNTFLLNESSSMLREHVAKHWTLEHLLDYSGVPVFEGAAVRACQLHLRREAPDNGHTYHFVRADQAPPEKESVFLNQASLQGRRHWGRPEITLDFSAERFTTIGDLCELRQGYKPYAKDTFIGRGMTPKQAEKVVKTRPYHHKEPAEGRILQRFGSEIKPFSVADGDDLARWVELDQTAETVPEEWQAGPRIAVREIAGASPNLIIAAYTEDRYVHDPSIISLRAKDGNEWTYPLLELYLNSAFCEEHVQYYSAKAGKGLFAKFTLGDLKELPVPKLEIIGEERIQACSDALGKVRSDSNNEALRAEIEDLLSAIYS